MHGLFYSTTCSQKSVVAYQCRLEVGYIVIAITIVVSMTVALAVIFGSAIEKGKQAGRTEIEVKIAGIFSVLVTTVEKR